MRRDHNLWRYLYFLYDLQKKDSTEYSGLESYIVSQVFTDRKDWMPLGRALSLEVANDHQNVEQKLSALHSRLIGIEDEINLLEAIARQH